MKLTFRRYSTARSGLKNAALIARSISARGNPILSIFAMASSRCDTDVRAEESFAFPPSAPVVAGTGEGVAGAFDVVFIAGAGAAGAAGVDAGAGAGVVGAFEADAEAAGAALGFVNHSVLVI